MKRRQTPRPVTSGEAVEPDGPGGGDEEGTLPLLSLSIYCRAGPVIVLPPLLDEDLG